jgi:hypothetical protein
MSMTIDTNQIVGIERMELGIDFDDPNVPFNAKANASYRWLCVYGEGGLASQNGGARGPDDQRKIVARWVEANASEFRRFINGATDGVENTTALYDQGNRRRDAVMATRAGREGGGDA